MNITQFTHFFDHGFIVFWFVAIALIIGKKFLSSERSWFNYDNITIYLGSFIAIISIVWYIGRFVGLISPNISF